jgi:hypothetical protein
MELIGTIVRLQIQRSSLKLGERPRRWFDPAPILEVPELRLSSDGVVGVLPDGDQTVDIHNRTHPQTRYGTGNGISVGFTSHYAQMRARHGDRITDGIAGENILVETERAFSQADLPAQIAIEGPDGLVQLEGVRVIEPCVEFSRYSRRARDRAVRRVQPLLTWPGRPAGARHQPRRRGNCADTPVPSFRHARLLRHLRLWPNGRAARRPPLRLTTSRCTSANSSATSPTCA